MIEEGGSMMFYLEIEKEKKKLNEMIEKGQPYEKILEQSRKVDELINKLILRQGD